ncbi:MAG TPA: hypothetical protein VFY16_06735 [Gemmatimonadaceae bacterium]|jgi:hypothetical protein|nr:hypothetical protein [Gemmatimonadaceae bacterium]
MTTPTNSDDSSTGPIHSGWSLWWALLAILVLALLGYAYFAREIMGPGVESPESQPGSGLRVPTAPTQSP